MKRGTFIVIEGGDGAGKDTQIEMLRAKLPEDQFLFVRDPGGTEIGEKLREVVLFDKRVSRPTELLIYLACRVQLADEKIKPALEAGLNVISNRFDLSTIAYQVYGRERHDLLPFVKQVSEFALSGTRPDHVVLLDCPPEIGLERTAKAKQLDRFEEEKLPFHTRVRDGYLEHIKDYANHHIVDASRTPEEIHRDVFEILEKIRVQ